MSTLLCKCTRVSTGGLDADSATLSTDVGDPADDECALASMFAVSGKEGESGRVAVKFVMLLSLEGKGVFFFGSRMRQFEYSYSLHAIGGVVRRHSEWLVNDCEWWRVKEENIKTALRWSTVVSSRIAGACSIL